MGVLNSRRIWWANEGHLVPLLDFVNCAAGAPVHRTVGDERGASGTAAAAVLAA